MFYSEHLNRLTAIGRHEEKWLASDQMAYVIFPLEGVHVF
jgi:hypothetical protein